MPFLFGFPFSQTRVLADLTIPYDRTAISGAYWMPMYSEAAVEELDQLLDVGCLI